MTQAVLNVMGEQQGKERYDTVPDEVRKYVLGYYGEIAGPIAPDLYDKITRGEEPVKERPGSLVPPTLPRVRGERGPFANDDDLLLAAYYADKEYRALKDAGPIDTEYTIGSTPLMTLMKEISERKSIKSIHIAHAPG